MEYREGDILICRQLFSTGSDYGRVIEKGDTYEIINLDNISDNEVWIQEITSEKHMLIYAEPLDISIVELVEFFSCQRVERVLKLKELR